MTAKAQYVLNKLAGILVPSDADYAQKAEKINKFHGKHPIMGKLLYGMHAGSMTGSELKKQNVTAAAMTMMGGAV